VLVTVLAACSAASSPGAAPVVGQAGAAVGPDLASAPSASRAHHARENKVSIPKVGAKSFLVANFDTGVVLRAKGIDVRRPIASLTKIMTAMVVMGRTRQTDMVVASKRAARQVPTKLGLTSGDRMDVRDLLYALMLHSSNDVAVALAEHVSGSVSAFDALMTTQGIGIGLTDTWFASPSGLNDKGYSTARDLATLTRWAYQSRRFAEIVATKRYTVRLPSGPSVRLRNLNALLFDYQGTLGVKTGYTSASHWSLVAVAERGHTRVIVVLLADPKVPFKDGTALLDWAFAHESSLTGRVG
jgi:D-alanyl-D-alanine carboxypeptidase